MNFDYTDKVKALQKRVSDFMDAHVYPNEGTFVRQTGLAPFRTSAFQVAVQAGIPVVPVALRGVHKRYGETVVYRGVDFLLRRGDRVARAILQDAGRELGELVIAVASRLKMLDEAFPVFPVGGVFEMGRLVLDPLRKTLRKRAPRSVIRPPEFPPEVGAALMALEAAGITLDAKILRRIAAAAR